MASHQSVPARLDINRLRSQHNLAIPCAGAVFLGLIATLVHWYLYARPEPTLNLIVASLAGAPAWVGIGVAERLRRAELTARSCCPRCGYDLRATPDRCPECGTQRTDHLAVIYGQALIPTRRKFWRFFALGLCVQPVLFFVWQAVAEALGWGTLFAGFALLNLSISAFVLFRLLTVCRRTSCQRG